MQNRYKREMEKLGPRPEELERLYAMVEGGTATRRTRRLGRRAAAAVLACAALAVTAVAAGPTVWQALQARLGTFAPYAVPAEGTAVDRDIEVALVGSISDSYTARVYFTATDLAGGRFNDHTDMDAMLESSPAGIAGGFGLRVLSYDQEQGRFLVEASADGLDAGEPVTLRVSRFDPGCHYVHADFRPPQSAAALQSTAAEGGDTVLLPGQTPQTSPDCEGVVISSMGFDETGLFHVRIAWEEGYSATRALLVMPVSKTDPHQAVYQENMTRVPVEGGFDFRFPALTAERLDDLDHVQIYGPYRGPEEAIEGSWSIPVTLEQAGRMEIALDRQVGGFQVSRAEVSPLTLAVFHTRPTGTGFLDQAQVVEKDGTETALTAQMGSVIQEEDGFGVYSLFFFEEPIDLEDIASIRLMGEEVWTAPEA